MTSLEKKQLGVFIAFAFVLNFLMAIPLYLAKERGLDLNLFPLLMMHMPAAGVIAASFIHPNKDPLLPKAFFILYLVVFFGLLVLTLVPFIDSSLPVLEIGNGLILVGSALSWGFILSKKEKAQAYNITGKNGKTIAVITGIFLIIYFLRVLIFGLIEGNLAELKVVFQIEKALYLFILPINFFLSFLPFFGEEYGWRFFLQPLLEKRFGMVKGVLVLGLVWGIWHLPLNLFYYSSKGMEAMSLLNQIVNCLTLSLFMAYAYNKSRSILCPVIIHYLNNNLIPLFAKDLRDLDSLLQNQNYSWRSIGLLLAFGLVFFASFALSKYMREGRYRMKTLEEIQEGLE